MNINVYPLPLAVPGTGETIFPSLIRAGDEMILVDTGYPGQADAIVRAAADAGLAVDKNTKIVLTHHDFDHVGSLQALKTKFPQAIIIAPAKEAPYINGSRKAFRLQQAEEVYDSLPDEAKEGARQFAQFLQNIAPCEVDKTVEAGEVIDAEGNVIVLATPGHTEGHISLYIRPTRTVISGDALLYEDGMLKLANPHYAYDLPQARESAKKIRDLEPETVLCYHGGVCSQASKTLYATD